MCGNGAASFLSSIPLIAANGGAVLPLGIVGSFPNIPFKFQILEWTLESPLAGTLTFDVLANTFAANGFPSTSITGAAPPTMVGVKSATHVLTVADNWTTTFAPGTSLAFQITAIATITLATVSLKIRRYT